MAIHIIYGCGIINLCLKNLKKGGFIEIRNCKFNDSEDLIFKLVENESRFKNAVAIECKK